MLDSVLVGRVIQKFREDKGLSQEVVSGFADIGRTHLSAIERGARKPTLETFYRIAEAMNIKPSVLLKAIEEEIGKASDFL
ncbi:MAG: helix-turn-helix transcriptional regulator [Clostridia bacterium]|nr:helix-turn-helix transcriptional regulator [Clostridia bacterium]